MRNPSLVHLPFESSKLTEGLDSLRQWSVTLVDVTHLLPARNKHHPLKEEKIDHSHNPASSLVRNMLTEFKEQLYLVYAPAYDPDTHRIEWLWRVSRRIVTHNHHRRDFDQLLTDVRNHFHTLSQTPDDLLRHLGSPFAPDKRPDRPQAVAA